VGEARSRLWIVPESLPEQRANGEVIAVDRQEAIEAFAEAESVLYRVGGTLVIGPLRKQLGDGRWVTEGYAFEHKNYMPADRKPPETSMIQDADEVLDPEPAAA
jgi:hypothetical protein